MQPAPRPSAARCPVRLLPLILAMVAIIALTAVVQAQVVVKVNDDVNFKFGLLAQPQARWTEDPSVGGYSQDLFLRRLRLLLGGQLSKKVSFFVETDSPNFGATVAGKKNTSQSMYLQDAFVTIKFSDKAMLDAGEILIPFSHNGLQSAASLLPIDYGAHSFAQSGPTQSVVGRDTGLQARGFVAGGKLEYRAGVFSGLRDDRAHNSFRGSGRLQYNFLDAEPGFFYAGTYLGKKKVFSIGAGIDTQRGYRGYDGDVFFDYPLASGVFTTQLDYFKFDGGTFMANLPEQKDLLFEAGYLIGATKFEPVVQIAKKDVAGTSAGDETRYGVGLNYWLSGHNTNFKFNYTKVDLPGSAADANQFTFQVQLFYF